MILPLYTKTTSKRLEQTRTIKSLQHPLFANLPVLIEEGFFLFSHCVSLKPTVIERSTAAQSVIR
jgi:hypothetical protein